MTIEQTVEISADRRLHLDMDIPKNLPLGKTTIHIQFGEVSPKPDAGPPPGKTIQDDFERHFDEIFGSFANSKAFKGDPVELVRTMRDHQQRPPFAQT
jgi:hypothetical protein